MYIFPPSDSLVESIFSFMHKISILEECTLILMVGDFNAEISSCSTMAFCNQELADVWSIPEPSLPGHIRSDRRGLSFLHYLRMNDLVILNGRFQDDSPASLSFHALRGQSLVDYIVVSYQLFGACTQFKVWRTNLSNHSIL